MRHTLGAALIAALFIALCVPARADVSLAQTLESRCSNAMDARDFGTAVVVCPRAAEEWANTADEISSDEPAHYMALLSKATMLSKASLANRTQSNQRESVYFMQRAVETASEIAANNRAPGDVRSSARDAKSIFQKMLTYERSHPV